MICQLVHLFEFCANQLIIEKIVINYVNLFFQRLLHDYTHEKRQVWDKADLNLFQYSRLCQIMDFQPPGHWDRPNFCEVMRDNNLDTIFVSFERVPGKAFAINSESVLITTVLFFCH